MELSLRLVHLDTYRTVPFLRVVILLFSLYIVIYVDLRAKVVSRFATL